MNVLKEMSVRERDLWVELLTNLLVAIYYFPKLFILMAAGDAALMGKPMVSLISSTIILAIFVAIILVVILKLFNLKGTLEKEDERERSFSAKGSLGAYWVLFVLICILIGQIILDDIFGASRQSFVVLTPVLIAHLLLISLMISGTTKSVIQLYYYRRGY